MARLGLRTQSLLALLAPLAATLALPWLPLGADLGQRFLPDDPAVVALAREQQRLGAGQTLWVLAEWREAPPVAQLLAPLEGWSRELAGLDGVVAVDSLLDIPVLRWTSPDTARVRRLGDSEAVVAEARRQPLARKLFVRPDGGGVALAVHLESGVEADARRRARLWRQLQAWRDRPRGAVTMSLVGVLPLTMEATDAAVDDLWRISVPLAASVLALLAWGLGAPALAAAVVAVAALAPLAALGSAAWFGLLTGTHLSQFSLIAATVVFTVALLDNIHIACAWQRARRDGIDGEAAARAAVGECLRPCVWTTVTTIGGFAVLGFGSIPQVRQFGALSVVGATWALWNSLTLLPGLLACCRRPGRPKLEGLVASLGALPAGVVVAAFAVTTAVAVPGLAHLRVVSDFPRLLVDEDPVTRGLERVEHDWGGVATVSLLVERRQVGSAPGATEAGWLGLGDADRDALVSLVSLLSSRELVTAVLSPADVWAPAEADYRRRFGHAPGPPAFAAAARAWGELAAAERARWFADAADGLRIVARVRMMQPEKFPALVSDLEGFSQDLSGRFVVRATGWPLVYKNLEQRLLGELGWSFLEAFVVVLALLAPALGSPAWWLLALAPNLIPLVVVLGALGWTGVGFASGLLLAPGIALGLVVDDTIHFVTRVRRGAAAAAGLPPGSRRSDPEAIEVPAPEALAAGGAPITLTSAVLVVGFATLALSRFAGNRTLAAVMVAVVALAWLGDVALLPALIRLAKRLRLR